MRPTELQLPPVAIADPKVAKAAATYARLVKENTATANRLHELGLRRPAAVEEDRLAYARAIRAGKPDPGTKAVDAIDAELAATQRRSEALALAVSTAQAELVAVVEARRAAWGAEVDRQVAEARAEVASAVEGLAAARDKLSEHLSLAGWLSRFPHKTAWMPPAALNAVDGLVGPNGDCYAWGAVLIALRRYGGPPAAPAALRRVAASSLA